MITSVQLRRLIVCGLLMVLVLGARRHVWSYDAGTGRQVIIKLDAPPADRKVLLSVGALALTTSDEGQPVTIILDGRALELVAQAQTTEAKERCEFVARVASRLEAAGGGILVCPECAKRLRLRSADLPTGVRIGTDEVISDVTRKAVRVYQYGDLPPSNAVTSDGKNI